MGTRADFYIGRGLKAEWLGSIAYDGYPRGVPTRLILLAPATVEAYRTAVYELLAGNDAASVPDHGWPWPWDDSRTTDYAYAFDDGKIWASSFGHEWFVPDLDADDCGEPDGGPKVAEFPDMSKFKNVARGRRSGMIMISLGEGE